MRSNFLHFKILWSAADKGRMISQCDRAVSRVPRFALNLSFTIHNQFFFVFFFKSQIATQFYFVAKCALKQVIFPMCRQQSHANQPN
jgi:hypothetical protein